MTQAQTTVSNQDLSENGDYFPKAVKRAAKLLRLSPEMLARAIGVSHNTSQRILAGQTAQLGIKATGRAIQLIAVWRAIHGLVGGDDTKLQTWLKTANNGLGGIPQELITEDGGLERVLAYFYGSSRR